MTTTLQPANAPVGRAPAPIRRPVSQVTPASPSLRFTIAAAIACMPVLVPNGPGNTSPADLPIVLAIGGVLLWLARNGVRVNLPYALGMWLLMTGGAIAALANADVRSTAPLAQDLFLLLWAGTIASAVRADRSLVRLICATWCWSGVTCASLLILGRLAGISWLAGQTLRDGSRSALTFGDPNLAGNYFVACLFLVLASRHPRRPLPRTAAVLAIAMAIVFTGSNGALVGMVVGVVAGLIVGRWRSRGPVAATGLACVLLVGAGLLLTSVNWTSLQEQAAASGPVLHDSFGRSDSSSADRQVLFAEGVRLYWSGDLVGIGPGRTKNVLAAMPAPYVKEAHNDYVATILELGAIGAVGLVVLLTTVATRLQRLAGTTARGRWAALTAGMPSPQFLVAMGAAFLVSGAFYEVLHFRHLWAFLGLLAGLDLIRADTAEAETSDAGRR